MYMAPIPLSSAQLIDMCTVDYYTTEFSSVHLYVYCRFLYH